MTLAFKHIPVMPHEVMSFFVQPDDKIFVDATAGGGGHLSMLARACTKGQVFAFDQDPRAHLDDAAAGVAKQFPNVTLFHRPFSRIKETLRELHISHIDGLLCDLGVSSHQLDDKSRGFSFMDDGPIDMRMDPTSGISAYEWLARTREEDIADAIFRFGGERKSRAIARKIKGSWPIENSTLVLAQLILSAMRQRHWSKVHPATRAFQAIRMAVNNEVAELEQLLHDLPDLLNINGVGVFISFHSVEDGLIKHAFRALAARESSPTFKLLTKKPVSASEEEVTNNRRSRSAKVRAIMRVS